MARTESSRDDAALALYAEAGVCDDARRRGVILALATHYEGVGLSDAARIWGVDPAVLRDALRRFEEGGLDGLFSGGASATPPPASPRPER